MARNLPWGLALAYVLDWFLLLCIAAVGGGISYIRPYHRPFSLLDLSISFPNGGDEISTAVLVIVSLIAPAIIIFLVTVVLIPPPNTRRRSSSLNFWKTKLWEINAGWLGLGLSFVLAFMLTQGIKNLFGKPRPDLLSRCLPDLSNVAANTLGGFGQDISARWTLVSSTICTQTDQKVLDEGFRSFLSGHSSMSWSGLLYLSFWLALKFNVTFPQIQAHRAGSSQVEKATTAILPMHNGAAQEDRSLHPRQSASAPPIFGVIACLVPICVAIFISSTRYVDFKHHGVDIFSGSLLGVFTAWLAFRYYHSSLTQGYAWTWGPRAERDAWSIRGQWNLEGKAASRQSSYDQPHAAATVHRSAAGSDGSDMAALNGGVVENRHV